MTLKQSIFACTSIVNKKAIIMLPDDYTANAALNELLRVLHTNSCAVTQPHPQ